MVLGPVVGYVFGPRGPVVPESPLGVATRKPVETHVHGFGASWLDIVVDDSKRSGVVCLDGGLGLFVANLSKELAHWDCLSCVDI